MTQMSVNDGCSIGNLHRESVVMTACFSAEIGV
jgi:hypothetical protein